MAMDDHLCISSPRDFVMESDLQHSSDDTWVDAQERQTKKEAALGTRPKHALSENDISVMRGIAQSGALSVQREIGGIYSPNSSFRPCGDLPTTPTAYLHAQGLYKCGLSDLIIGKKSKVVIHWPPQLIHKASRQQALVWHTHPDYPDPNIIHMPPSVLDFFVGLHAALDFEADVDQLIVTRTGLWRLHTRFNDVARLSREQLENEIHNFQYYAASIQSDEHIKARNAEVDVPIQKLRVHEFVELMNRNIEGFSVEFHPFSRLP